MKKFIKNIFRLLRKEFNIPLYKESKAIYEGVKSFKDIIREYTETSNKQHIEKTHITNTVCGICNSKNVINKILRIQGETISGFYNKTSFDTKNVKHCNVCGNQWYEEPLGLLTVDTCIINWFKSLALLDLIIISPGLIPPESLFRVFQEYKYKCNKQTREKITLWYLRQHFKSAYDL